MQGYASVRRVRMKPGSAAAIAAKVNSEGLALMRSVQGFRAYHQVFDADNVVTSLTIYDSAASAEQGNRVVVPWIQKALAEYVVSSIDAHEGELIVSHTA